LESEAATVRKVRFADETSGYLAEVIEVESLKILSRFSKKDRANAEVAWREELLAQLLDESSEVQKNALRRLEGVALGLAFSDDGYGIVNKAAEVARLYGEEETFMCEFYGHVRILALSSSGSEVLETCMDTLGPIASSAIARELVGFAAEAAIHETAYSVICHLLENQPPKEIEPLVVELRMAEDQLGADPWGQLVLDCMP
jgi:hypothetical protein